MTVINPVINVTHGSIEHQLFASYYVMEPGAVSSCHPVTKKVCPL